jgi:hypothetical protein
MNETFEPEVSRSVSAAHADRTADATPQDRVRERSPLEGDLAAVAEARQDRTRAPGGSSGTVSTGAGAVGAAAIGAFAIGALAIGALAVGRLAIGRLSMKRARIHALAIDDLEVGRLRVKELIIEPDAAAQQGME